MASVVASDNRLQSVEIGLIGCEGTTAFTTALGIREPAVNECYQQVGGSGFRIERSRLLELIEKSPTLHQSLLRYCYALLIQVGRTAAANARNKVEERLARWLLLADDRLRGQMSITQEFLAIMLGIHRPNVTISLLELERRELIKRARGQISVIDRPGLIHHSNLAYDPVLRA